ncbi:MAG: class I SAM-dependent methyltransferase [Candidatus Bathyarchaeia archaeon]
MRVDVSKEFLSWRFKPTVLADAHYLPFRDRSFDVVKASHVLEHLKNPWKALDEMMRVSSKEITIKFPTELDVKPWLFSISSFSSLRMAISTRKRRLHLWLIKPEKVLAYLKSRGWNGTYTKNTICLFHIFECGRKAKYFKWLTKHFRIPFEYELKAKRNCREANRKRTRRKLIKEVL